VVAFLPARASLAPNAYREVQPLNAPRAADKEKLRYQATGVLPLSLGGHRCPSAGPSPTKGGSHKPTHDPTQSVHLRWTPFPAYTSHFSFLLFPPSHKLSGLFLISSPPRFRFNRRRVVRCHDFLSSWVLLLRRFPGISTSNTVFLPLSYSPYLSTSRESSFPRSFAWAVTPAAASLASLTTTFVFHP
jgi:hypothetical protein